MRVLFSQHDVLYIFILFLIRVLGSVNLGSFKADKGIEFLLPTKLEKNRSSKGLIFRACSPTGSSPKLHNSQLAPSPTGTFRNIFFVLFRIWVPTCRYTLYFVFILFDIADLRKVVSIEHFFLFFSLIWKVLLIRKDILYTFRVFHNFSVIR